MDAPISVVIPLFNKENCIRRSILSVLNQTFSQFELIVVDDGSTDDSYEIAQAICDDRIRIIRQPNGGECAARNRGVRESKHAIVAFLDADDEWLPGFLEKIHHLRNGFSNCGVYATAFHFLMGNPPDWRKNSSPYAEGWEGIIENYYHSVRVFRPLFCASSIAIRKDVFHEIGGFTEGVIIGGDQEMWVRLATLTSFAFANAPLAVYHLEAENRALELHREKTLVLGANVRALQVLLKEGKVPPELRAEARELISYAQLNYVGANLRSGNRSYALKLLLQWRFSKTYLRRWLSFVHSWIRG